VREQHTGWPEDGVAGQLANFEIRDDGTAAPWLTPARHLSILRALWEHRPSAWYGELDVPVVIVKAEGPTSALTDEQVARAEAAIPQVRVVRLPGHHDLHAEQPDKVAAALLFGVDAP
jgi:pimeloyl-ACP methyl ester carboxylesterase